MEARLHAARMWEVRMWSEGAVSMILKKFPSGGEERDRGLSGRGGGPGLGRLGKAGRNKSCQRYEIKL